MSVLHMYITKDITENVEVVHISIELSIKQPGYMKFWR